MTKERLIKHPCVLVADYPFVGRNRLDQPTRMSRYVFLDRLTEHWLVWNTVPKPQLMVNRSYLISATPLESEPKDYGKGPELRVTRCKVYNASSES